MTVDYSKPCVYAYCLSQLKQHKRQKLEQIFYYNECNFCCMTKFCEKNRKLKPLLSILASIKKYSTL